MLRRKLNIPAIPDPQDHSAEESIEALKEAVEIREGRRGGEASPDRFVSIRMLVDLGLITEDQANSI